MTSGASGASVVGLIVGLALLVVGAAAIAVAHHQATIAAEDRHAATTTARDRRLVLWGAAVVGAAAVVGLAVPAARRLDRATAALRDTRWEAGRRLVTRSGEPVPAADVPSGALLTVYPAGAIDVPDSQAILIREEPARFGPALRDAVGVVDGLVAYSKLCTHMACPLGLYQQSSGTLLCPCHQAVFDVLNGGVVLEGPARRSLPRLPLVVDDDGLLVALGDFTGPVGTGFWDRP